MRSDAVLDEAGRVWRRQAACVVLVTAVVTCSSWGSALSVPVGSLAPAMLWAAIPAVLTAVETESFSGYIWPQLLDVFPGQPIVERTSMNSWDDAGFRKAIEATGRKNILMTGLWTEVCITWPTIEMLAAGYTRPLAQGPTVATLERAEPLAPLHHVLELRGHMARVAKGSGIDLGGIAKGWMADRLSELLGPNCVVNLGGDLRARGSWPIGVGEAGHRAR